VSNTKGKPVFRHDSVRKLLVTTSYILLCYEDSVTDFLF